MTDGCILSIVSSDGKYHIFDKRPGQTVGALVARDFATLESAVEWANANYPIVGQWNKPDKD